MGSWVFPNDWLVNQVFSGNQRVARTQMACFWSRKKNQAKLWVVGLHLEFTTNTELKTKSATNEAMSSISKVGISMLTWGLIIEDSTSLCLLETLTNWKMLRREGWEGGEKLCHRETMVGIENVQLGEVRGEHNPIYLESNQPGANVAWSLTICLAS